RPGDRAGLDVGQLLGSGDGVLVLLADEDLLPGDVIRPGLADDLAPLVGDGVRGDDDVDVALLQERLAVVRDGLGPGDVFRRDTQRSGDDLPDLDVEPTGHVLTRCEVADAGLIDLHADLDGARLGKLGHGAARREVGVLFDLDARFLVVASARR